MNFSLLLGELIDFQANYHQKITRQFLRRDAYGLVY